MLSAPTKMRRSHVILVSRPQYLVRAQGASHSAKHVFGKGKVSVHGSYANRRVMTGSITIRPENGQR